MADIPKKPDGALPELDENNLIRQIDELEALLARKKAEAQIQESTLPKLNVGTDGIPVLVDVVTEDSLMANANSSLNSGNEDSKLINDIIDKVDKEITEDLDELILMLKDSIIDEVKTRLLKELKLNKDKSNKEQ